ncbi:hypothetical protein N7528_006546 [Penicillium herquei]|nr:hypothetical protein N7528_006546 [Penicillium herquei]
MDSDETYRSVRERYADVANQTNSAAKEAYEQKVATAFGYDLEDLRSIPENANLGVSCGNPLATANIALGETVVDLGSGGGIDVLLAAKKAGPEGKAIGIDMTKDMLELARRNAKKSGVSNAVFIEAFITSIPLPASTVDCIISNCVVNLVPEAEKNLVFKEMFRLLKPGGRVAISDILATQELPMEIKSHLSLYVGCIAGASQVADYERYMKEAGFQDVFIMNTNSDLNIYKEILLDKPPDTSSPATGISCCSSAKSATSKELPDVDFNHWTGSFRIFAIKPEDAE